MNRPKSLSVFPYILIRTTGLSIAEFNKLNITDSLKIADQIQQIDAELTHEGIALSDKIHAIIPSLHSNDLRDTMLQARRDIFNKRLNSLRKLQSAQPHLSPELYKEIEKFANKITAFNNLKISGHDIYTQESNEKKHDLDTLVSNKNFANAIVLSSESLSQKMNDRSTKTVVGLMKYLSRMASKTSPFSTFTNLSIAEVTNDPNPTIDKPHVSTHVRLNNDLFKYILGLLFKNKKIYTALPIKTNPSIVLEAGKFTYLTNSNNRESFQRISKSESIETVFKSVHDNKNGIVLNEMVDNIHKSSPKISRDEIISYVYQLFEYGFFEFHIGVSGTDTEWDIKLVAILAQLRHTEPVISELIATLRHMRISVKQYETASFAERKNILKTMYDSFKTTCMNLHIAADLPKEELESFNDTKKYLATLKHNKSQPVKVNKPVFKHTYNTYFPFNPKQLIYEDAVIPAAFEYPAQQLHTYATKLNTLVTFLRRYEGHQEDKKIMIKFFKKFYKNVTKVDLLTFYEMYYREVKKKPIVVKKKKTKKEDRWMSAFIRALKLPKTPITQIDITPSMLQKISQEYKDTHHRRPSSFGAFVQFYDNGDNLNGVINGIFPGNGKMLSRFLHLFDPKITKSLRSWNQADMNDEMYAEVTDSSFFNANLHPPLMPFEITPPNSHVNLEVEQRIQATDIEVSYDIKNRQLMLKHKKTGKIIRPFDVTFQGHGGRSELFRLLHVFSGAPCMSFYSITDAINRKMVKKQKNAPIKTLPRIIYDDQIILQRKKWHINKEELPSRAANEDNWTYFLRVYSWKSQHNLPDAVFVRIPQYHAKTKKEKMLLKNIKRDDYKPQLIDFRNPYLVQLFSKIIERTPKYITADEVLPVFADDITKHVREYVIQWKNNG